MCGIAGVLSLNNAEGLEAGVRAMAHTIRHRGPDHQGFYFEPHLGLAHLRLSILDLSENAHQPMSDESGRYHLIYNGEVYNYLELKTELAHLGHTFKTTSDTEVVLKAFIEYGPRALDKFNGMWAFVIWDSQEERLFGARDRFGIKPLYYSLNADHFVFGSEIKALLAYPGIKAIPNHERCYEFLNTQLCNDDREQTFFKGISQLPPATYFWMDRREGFRKQQYWDLKDTPPLQLTEHEMTTRFRELFFDSIQLQLRSDVTIGTCLSGGLDSSSIVCAAAQLSQSHQQENYQQATFSSCFEDPRFDERTYIKHVLDKTGATPHFIFPEPQKLESELMDLVYAQDEPFASLSIFAQRCIMERVQQTGVKVLLDGQGADEILAGYGFDSYYWVDLWKQQQWSTLLPELQATWKQKSLTTLARRSARMIFPALLENHKEMKNLQKWPFYNPWIKAGQFSLPHRPQVFQDYLKNDLYYQLKYSLISLLRYEDRNSMSFSIEARVPFLDYRLVEYLFQIPQDMLIRKGWSKWILRQSMQDILPSEVQWRKDKMGFVTPQEVWFKEALKPMVFQILNSESFHSRPYWDARAVLQAYQQWASGSDSKIHAHIWSILSVELWLRRFID